MIKKLISLFSPSPTHEHTHRPKKVEIILALLIAMLLATSLLTTEVIKIPSFLTPILIILFMMLKAVHIFRKGGTILEDYASLGALGIFLLIDLIIGGKLNVVLIMIAIGILLYSTGLMIWLKESLTSSRSMHFIVGYVMSIIMIIGLFAGAYYTEKEDFISNGIKKPITFEDALYISTITFTTVGYGDILPLGINRLLASIEALIGMVINIAFMGYILSSGRFRNPQ